MSLQIRGVRSFIVIICHGTVTELYQTVRKLLLTVPGLSESARLLEKTRQLGNL
jgi:hypothetical protein